MKTINDWVKGETDDRIETTIDGPLSPQAVMVLVNAVAGT